MCYKKWEKWRFYIKTRSLENIKGLKKKFFLLSDSIRKRIFQPIISDSWGPSLDVVFQISSRPDAFTTERVHSARENLIDAPLSTYPLLGTPLRALLPKPTSLERGQISYFVSRRRQMLNDVPSYGGQYKVKKSLRNIAAASTVEYKCCLKWQRYRQAR